MQAFILWVLSPMTARHSSKFSIFETLNISPDKELPSQIEYATEISTAASTREMHEEGDISLRISKCICTKILHYVYSSLPFRYTRRLNPQPFLNDVDSFNESTDHNGEDSRFWAVLIGIDAYEYCPLRGCVSDAVLVERYLKEHMGVPQERIRLLLGSQNTSSDDPSFPSRDNIINALLNLIDNPEINNGDNIIVYFSGHGSGYSSREYYHHDINSDDYYGIPSTVYDSIEAICPIDRHATDASGFNVPDISDREINAIFKQVSETKGHRITFILDACHSGTHTRRFPEPGARTVPPLPRESLRRMLHIADETLGRYPSYRSIFATDWCPDMSSHVIVAACKEYQTAKEVESGTGTRYNGIFTQALVSTLMSGVLSDKSTYVDLLLSLPRIDGQTPVVAGAHKYEHLWYKD